MAPVVRRHRSEDAELVAAESERRAERLDRIAELPAEPTQQEVALQMPERVVVRLEAVEVEEDQQVRLVEAVEALHEPAPVGQPRQSIVVGQMLELCLEALALADVDDRSVQVEDLAVGVADGPPLLMNPA